MILQSLFWLVLFVLVYIYIGYPLLVKLLAGVRKGTVRADRAYRPNVTLVISAFNEEGIIRKKLENSLKLDYPKDKLAIWVISDASSDKTDQLVQTVNDQRVRLLRLKERKGKTFGINALMQKIKSDLVVFSDANSIYEQDAVAELVKYFADPQVGYVVGQAKYYKQGQSKAGEHESTYWSFEIKLKINESRLGSVVGGDGAIYAIRRKLFKPLQAEDINDFVNPIQIILQGYRGIFNPRAVCYEETADTFEKEFKRKRRIVNRSWRGLWSNAPILNPFRCGLFAWQIFSHKLLRWLGGVFLILLFILNILLLNDAGIYRFLFTGQLLFYLLAFSGRVLERNGKEASRFVSIPYYFVMVNLASILGIVDAYLGKTYTTWQTIREN